MGAIAKPSWVSITSLLAIAAALMLHAPVAAADVNAATRPPAGFLALQGYGSPSEAEFLRMHRGGVHLYRRNFTWAFVEPTPGTRDWHEIDAALLDAARAGIDVLPDLLGSPPFAARDIHLPPKDSAARQAWARWVGDAVRRYGPNGTLWRAHPDVAARPIRVWQVWNEPNLPQWSGKPNAAAYVAFLRLTAHSVRQVDPQAKIVSAGIPERKRGMTQQQYVAAMYKAPGFREAADIVAIHPYAVEYTGVLGAVARIRKVMAAAGDGTKQLWLTEVGWPTGGTGPLVGTPARQAQQLRLLTNALAERREADHIRGMIWFCWRDFRQPGGPDPWAFHMGLFRVNGTAKPAWSTFVALTGGDAGSGPL